MNRVPRGSARGGRETPHRWLTAFIAMAAGVAIANNYALQPALPAERLRYNIKPVMGLAAGAMSGMSLMKMGLVLDMQAFG